MYPELLRLGPFVISSFGFMMVVAFGICYYLIDKETQAQKWPRDLAADMVFWAALGGIAGAKIYYLIENIGSGSASNMAGLGEIFAGLFTLNFGKAAAGIQNFGAGLVFFGSLIGGMLAVTILLRRRGVAWMPTADVLAPYLILGYAVGRIGCFLVGDDYGVPSSLPWAVAFPNGLPPTLVPVHPTQIYEVILGLIIFAFLYRMRGKIAFTGQLFATYLILAGVERFFIEIIRTNNRYLLGLTGAQWIGMMMVGVGGYLFYARAGSGAPAPSR